MFDLATFIMVALAGFAVTACAGEADGDRRRTEAAATQSPHSPEGGMNESNRSGGVARLPYARGKTFRTLDEYLAHLERQGAIDLPWWRKVKPGLYERVTSRVPPGPPERATREELMRRFGFTR